MEAIDPTAFVFNTHVDAEDAVFALSRTGLDVTKLSLIGRGSDIEDRPLGFYTKGKDLKACGGVGAFWGAMWGLLFAPAVLYLPGLGLIAMAGPIVSQLVGVLEGSVVVPDLSPLGSALSLSGVQRDQISQYELALKSGKYLLMVAGNSRDLMRVRTTLLALHIPQVA
jgi:hypothetical protein